ncbi:MAG: UDP-N-acetylmuramoyl-tripeptide--D-alanyl-D-alanine ligase [bacterium]|nr:UDP-N-acetylmuramoyl-tripeptide--D-alanyl-D-alanine ligase [bacterium]
MLYYFVYFLMYSYTIKTSIRALHMLQQNLYNENNRYIKWINNNKKTTIINYSIISIFLSILMIFCNKDFINNTILLFIMIVYVLSYFIEKKISSNNQNKTPLVYTSRVKRLIITLSIIYLTPFILFIVFNNNIIFLISIILSSNVFITTYIGLIINIPIEKMVYKHFEKSAKEKLREMKNLKVIGITGSYGKTSSKNILNDILSVKFNTLKTPKNLNTFYGLMITINNHLSKFDEIFIAEMGAYVKGEINGLCDLVNPQYGIVTKIGTAHLESFGSEKNIQEAKMELIEHLPRNGIGILNGDDEKQVSYKLKNKCKIIWIGIENENVDVRAINIKAKGLINTFDVMFKGDKKKYHFETKLLGNHNIYNILSSIALGYELGISIKDLQKAVQKVKQIEHRLELKKVGNFYQIDDAYNSNPIGAKSALDVLSNMDGYKVVVTPGMIELGKKEYDLNKEFGIQISKVADFVILIGKKQTKPIYDGLISMNYSKDKIKILNDVRDSYTFINKLNKKEIYALYENDLPDTYNE